MPNQSIWDYTKRYSITAKADEEVVSEDGGVMSAPRESVRRVPRIVITEASNGEWVRVEDVHEIRERGWKDGWQHWKDMLVALENLLDRYTGLVNSGDCGNWNPEEEDEVIAARKFLK